MEAAGFPEVFHQRKEYLKNAIFRYEEILAKRKDQVAFMENDVILLEKIKGIRNLSCYRDGINIDM